MSRNVLASVTLAGVTALIGAGAGYWLASSDDQVSEPLASATESDAQVLYWYDPMVPQHRFEKPGKSPFMDMDLVPRYANEDGDVATISIDAGITQNLGIRLATVSRGKLVNVTEAVGLLEYNARDVALVQARAGGFVERVYRHAPGDVLDKGAALADLLIPEWSAAQRNTWPCGESANQRCWRPHGSACVWPACRHRPSASSNAVARSTRPLPFPPRSAAYCRSWMFAKG